ncbi:hypothetical protein [uncultured Alistipes sp.]|uniref:hypothetical protein n=1 Tax=uncultured Alistipes sp. TaxID=538949 RepID=UPI0025EBE322|nr:hypothetical protein [uncultured Alistipes sp.]
MRRISALAFILCAIYTAGAQTDTTVVIRPDSSAVIAADTLAAAPEHTNADPLVDNTSTVDLILNSQNEDQTNQIKESLLTEQLEAVQPGNMRQKRLIEQQLEELKASDSIRRVEQRRQIDSLKKHASGAPVTLNRDTIYLIYTNMGSFTPNERATLNSQKISKTAKLYSMKNDSLFIVDGVATSNIMYRETILASVTDTDALWMDTERQQLAKMYAQQIVSAIGAYKKSIGLLNVLKMIGLCALVLLVQFGLLKGVSVLFRRVIDKKLVAKQEK